jgi:diguanylate cyclase (GGDEF)-like protein/PAS domain S-box-containing protein
MSPFYSANSPASQESLHFFHQILDQARDIILVVQSDGRIRYANQAAAGTYGYSIDELLNTTIMQLRAEETHYLVTEQLKAALSSGTLFRTFHRRKNGEVFPVEVSSKKMEFAGITAGISIIRDISQITEIEQILRESDQKQLALNEELIATNEELTASNEELTAMNEELMASEEELRSQFVLLQEKDAQISRQNELLTSLHDAALGLMGHREVDELLSKIISSACRLIGTEHGFIYQFDPDRHRFRRTHGTGIYQRDIGREIDAEQGIVGQVRKTGQPAVVRDYGEWLRHNPQSTPFQEICTVLQVPLKTENQFLGTIGLAYCVANKEFGLSEIDILSRFADLAALALINAGLLSSFRQELQNRQAAEASLAKSQASLQAMAAAIPDLMFLFSSTGVILDYKPGPEPLLVAPELFLGRTIPEVFPPELLDLTLQHLQRTLETRMVQVFEYQITVKDKTDYFEARLSPSGNDEVLAICRNITERTLMESQLKHLSLHDALTGLYNRAFFEEEMRRLEKQRESTAGLLICDVDGLKIVNDSLGHDAGDEILKNVANILRQSFRGSDVIARIGGDEFVVLLNTNSAKIFDNACRRIKYHVAAYNNKRTMPISLSIGFALSHQSPPDMNSLFKEADNNMYREKLHQKLSARSAIVKGLIKALEARDFITEGHGDRLQAMVEAFARKIGLPERHLADLRLFAHFHDIGKVGIPDTILFKPAPLNDEEWKIMKQHCEIGHRIAMSTPDLAPIASWILKHQEWWNGKGYPLGIKGEAIPLECRLLSITDAFDAMTNDRPYRKAATESVALAELRRCAGSQFDPFLVDQFICLIEQYPNINRAQTPLPPA